MCEKVFLRRRLISDLYKLGFSLDCKLVLRPYSKTKWGYYDPNVDTIVLYMFSEKSCVTLIEYETLFKVLLHELVHAIQWKSSSWVRLKGVMHDPEFYVILNNLLEKAQKEGFIDGYAETA